MPPVLHCLGPALAPATSRLCRQRNGELHRTQKEPGGACSPEHSGRQGSVSERHLGGPVGIRVTRRNRCRCNFRTSSPGPCGGGCYWFSGRVGWNLGKSRQYFAASDCCVSTLLETANAVGLRRALELCCFPSPAAAARIYASRCVSSSDVLRRNAPVS
jgi:hypothetical protein